MLTKQQQRNPVLTGEHSPAVLRRQARMLRPGDEVVVAGGNRCLTVDRLVIGSEVVHVGFAGTVTTFEIPVSGHVLVVR